MHKKGRSGSGLWVLFTIAIFVGVVLHFEAASRFDLAGLDPEPGPLVLDCQGQVLRLAPEKRGRKLIKLPDGPLPNIVAAAFVAAEDQRFWWHCGVDPLAIWRAGLSNFKAGRTVSGASTITMQLARLTSPGPRTYYRKLVEMLRAVRIEAALPKTQILRHYLNRVPQGNNLMGVETAALAYFGKPAARLTAAEAALLAALAKAPGKLNPCGPNQARLLTRRNWVLVRMAELGYLSNQELHAARSQTLRLSGLVYKRTTFPFAAPHFVNLVLAEVPKTFRQAPIKTTLDLTLQRLTEALVASHRERLLKAGATQAAAVLVDNRTMAVLALVGSLEYGPRDQGFNNGACAWRSPGSTLKPFLYAQALDLGLTPAAILEDVARRYSTPGGEFIPTNYDRFAHGPVSFREALGNSLNLAAVRLLDQIGPERYYDTLRTLQLINHPDRGPEHYGLGLVVGNPEVNLLQLAAAYASLANGGVFRPLRFMFDEPLAAPRRVFSPQAAYIVTDILADPSARARIFGASTAMNPPYRLSLKTGTSTRYRDCWTVGYSPAYTLAVWVGNFDGRPTAGESGAAAAAPILADLAAELFRSAPPKPFPKPAGVSKATVCAFSGLKPGEGCVHLTEELFIAGTEPTRPCAYHRGQEPWHRLATPFAAWLNQRFAQAGAGRYRLAGFSTDLQETFHGSSSATYRVATTLRPDDKITLGAEATPLTRPFIAQRFLSGEPLVTVIYPLNGDRFLLEPQGHGLKLTLKAICQEPVPEVAWFVDGWQAGVTGPPYELMVDLSRGRHRLTVVGPGRVGDEVEVVVQ
jgi:penicillin-binding protein 1C